MADCPFAIEITDLYKCNRYLFVQGEQLIKVTFSIIKQYRNSDSHHIERIAKSNFVEYFCVYKFDFDILSLCRYTIDYRCCFMIEKVTLIKRFPHKNR